jgi:hypothetical protein
MSELSLSSFGGIISIVLGVCLFVSREWAARSALDWDYHALGLRIDEKWYRIAFVVWGVVFLVIGLLAMAGIIRLLPSF